MTKKWLRNDEAERAECSWELSLRLGNMKKQMPKSGVDITLTFDTDSQSAGWLI